MLRIRLLVLMLVGMTALVHPAFAATSCILNERDLGLLTEKGGNITQLAGRAKLLLSPCEGLVRPGGESLRVLISRTKGTTELVFVPAESRLSAFIGQPLLDMASSTGAAQTLWKVLTSGRPTRPGSRKFDSLEGVILGGNVLAGVELILPLEAFGWRSDQPVQIKDAAGKSRTIRVQNGLLRIPTNTDPDQEFSILQGDRQGHFTTVSAQEFPGLAQALQSIRTNDNEFRSEREALLLWEMDLQLNAISVNVSTP